MIKSRLFRLGIVMIVASFLLSFLYLSFIKGIQLEKPILSIKHDDIVEWQKVKHADYYLVYLNDTYIDKTTETSYDFDALNPFIEHIFKVEAYSNQMIYEKSHGTLSFESRSHSAYYVFRHGLNFNGLGVYGGEATNAFGNLIFQFRAPYQDDYLIEVFMPEDISLNQTLTLFTKDEWIDIPYDDELGGYQVSLEENQYIEVFFHDSNPLTPIYLSIEILNPLSLKDTPFLIIPSHTTVRYPIIQTEDDDLYTFSHHDDITVEIKDMYLNHLYDLDPFYYQSDISPLGRYIEIRNDSDQSDILFIHQDEVVDLEDNHWYQLTSFVGKKYFVIKDYVSDFQTLLITIDQIKTPYQFKLATLSYENNHIDLDLITFNQNLLESNVLLTLRSGHHTLIIIIESDTLIDDLQFKVNLNAS